MKKIIQKPAILVSCLGLVLSLFLSKPLTAAMSIEDSLKKLQESLGGDKGLKKSVTELKANTEKLAEKLGGKDGLKEKLEELKAILEGKAPKKTAADAGGKGGGDAGGGPGSGPGGGAGASSSDAATEAGDDDEDNEEKWVLDKLKTLDFHTKTLNLKGIFGGDLISALNLIFDIFKQENKEEILQKLLKQSKQDLEKWSKTLNTNKQATKAMSLSESEQQTITAILDYVIDKKSSEEKAKADAEEAKKKAEAEAKATEEKEKAEKKAAEEKIIQEQNEKFKKPLEEFKSHTIPSSAEQKQYLNSLAGNDAGRRGALQKIIGKINTKGFFNNIEGIRDLDRDISDEHFKDITSNLILKEPFYKAIGLKNQEEAKEFKDLISKVRSKRDESSKNEEARQKAITQVVSKLSDKKDLFTPETFAQALVGQYQIKVDDKSELKFFTLKDINEAWKNFLEKSNFVQAYLENQKLRDLFKDANKSAINSKIDEATKLPINDNDWYKILKEPLDKKAEGFKDLIAGFGILFNKINQWDEKEKKIDEEEKAKAAEPSGAGDIPVPPPFDAPEAPSMEGSAASEESKEPDVILNPTEFSQIFDVLENPLVKDNKNLSPKLGKIITKTLNQENASEVLSLINQKQQKILLSFLQENKLVSTVKKPEIREKFLGVKPEKVLTDKEKKEAAKKAKEEKEQKEAKAAEEAEIKKEESFVEILLKITGNKDINEITSSETLKEYLTELKGKEKTPIPHIDTFKSIIFKPEDDWRDFMDKINITNKANFIRALATLCDKISTLSDKAQFFAEASTTEQFFKERREEIQDRLKLLGAEQAREELKKAEEEVEAKIAAIARDEITLKTKKDAAEKKNAKSYEKSAYTQAQKALEKLKEELPSAKAKVTTKQATAAAEKAKEEEVYGRRKYLRPAVPGSSSGGPAGGDGGAADTKASSKSSKKLTAKEKTKLTAEIKDVIEKYSSDDKNATDTLKQFIADIKPHTFAFIEEECTKLNGTYTDPSNKSIEKSIREKSIIGKYESYKSLGESKGIDLSDQDLRKKYKEVFDYIAYNTVFNDINNRQWDKLRNETIDVMLQVIKKSIKKDEEILIELLPQLGLRCQGLTTIYIFLLAGYQEESFLRWATGCILWYFNLLSGILKDPVRFCTHQLIVKINNLDNALDYNGIEEACRDYISGNESKRRDDIGFNVAKTTSHYASDHDIFHGAKFCYFEGQFNLEAEKIKQDLLQLIALRKIREGLKTAQANAEDDAIIQEARKRGGTFTQIKYIAQAYTLSKKQSLSHFDRKPWNIIEEFIWIGSDHKNLLDFSPYAKEEEIFKYQSHLTYLNGIVKNLLKNQDALNELLNDYVSVSPGKKQLDRIADFISFLIKKVPNSILRRSDTKAIQAKIEKGDPNNALSDWKIASEKNQIDKIDLETITIDDIEAMKSPSKYKDILPYFFLTKIGEKGKTTYTQEKYEKEIAAEYASPFAEKQKQLLEKIPNEITKRLITRILENVSKK